MVGRRLSLFVVALLACGFARITWAADPPSDLVSQPLAPDESLKQIVVRPGLKVELVAAEPLIEDPVAVAWGPDGRLWVVEMHDYPLGLDGAGRPGGRIKFLTDDDGDGRYDRATLFLDGLQFPTAVLPWRDGVIGCAVPEIFYAADADGDGRADRRETLYSGLKVGNPQHLANGLRWGADGWIHCANGATKTPVKSEKTGAVVDVGTRDFRIRPDVGAIEPLAGRSQYVRDCDDWGNWFGSTNSEPLFHFVLEEQDLRRNPHAAYPNVQRVVPAVPGAAPVFPISPIVTRFNDLNKAGRFTSACGIAIYRDVLLGDDLYGNAFTCEPVHNLVHREVLEPDGPTFRGRRADDERKSEFLASRDPWFRPAMVRTGPDGALYVVDMYRLVIEHPEWIPKTWQAKLDLRAGSVRGRIYRVVPEHGKLRPVPRIDRLDGAELAALVDGPNGALRDLVVQRIVETKPAGAADGLRRVARVGESPAGRAAAVATLAVLDELDHDATLTALDDSDPRVRCAALRVAHLSRAVDGWTTSPSAGERVQIRTWLSAADADPRVRFQAAPALGALPRGEASRALARLLVDPASDAYLSAAAVSSLHEKNLAEVADAALAECALAKRPPTDAVAALIDTVAGYDDRPSLARLMSAVAAIDDDARRLDGVAVVLDGLSRHRLSLAKLSQSASPEFAALVDAWRRQLDAARSAAADPQAVTALRVASLAVFGHDPQAEAAELKTLRALLDPLAPEVQHTAAVSALSRFATPAAADLLIDHWTALSTPRKRQALAVLLNRDAWAERLLAAVGEKRLGAGEIDVTGTQRLLNHPNAKLRAAATRAFAAAIDPDRAAVVAKYVASVSSGGDAGRGRTLFTKSCGPCHKVGDVGTPTGPDLTALSDRSMPTMLTSIFDPNRAVESKYVGYTAVTDAGLTLVGLLVAETDATVTLAGADGKQQVLRRDELEQFVGTGRSFMPVGLEKDVSPEGAADLLAFLTASRTPPKSFAGNEPRLVRPEALRGELFFIADAAEAYGDTLNFATSPPRFTAWKSPNDRAEWEFEIVNDGTYELSIEYACPNDGGGAYVVDCSGVRLREKAAPTGGRESFRSVVLGPVNLKAGRHRVVVRSDGEIAPVGLFDLTSLRLRRK